MSRDASWDEIDPGGFVSPVARLLADNYADRIFAGDSDALDEALELADTARDIHVLPETEGRE